MKRIRQFFQILFTKPAQHTFPIEKVVEWLTKQAESCYTSEQCDEVQAMLNVWLVEEFVSHPLMLTYQDRIMNIIHFKRNLINWQMPKTEKR